MSRFPQYFISFLIVLCSVSTAAAQQDQIEFERFSIDQGLSQNNVTAIVQDSRGFMWFGTLDGLNKFDGYNFTVFKHSLTDPHSLSASTISELHEDRSGNLWIGTMAAGLNKMDLLTEQITQYRAIPGQPGSLSDGRIRAILQDRSGNLWVGTAAGGLNLFDFAHESFVHFRYDPTKPHTLGSDHVRSLFEDRDGNLWIGTFQGGLNLLVRDQASELTPETVKFIRIQHEPGNTGSLSNDHVEFVYQDSEGSLWVGAYGGGLDRLSSSALRKLVASVKDSSTEKAALAKIQFRHFKHDPHDKKSLSDNFIEAILQDHTGALWIGTSQGGFNRFFPETGAFVSYMNDPNNSASISYDNIECMEEDRSGNLWIGAWGGGLNKVDRKSRKFIHYKNDPDDSNSLCFNYVRAITEDPAGHIWVGTTGGGLDIFDRESGRVAHVRKEADEPGSISSDDIRAIFFDHEGALWVGAYGGGLNRLSKKELAAPFRGRLRFKKYLHDATNPGSLSNNYVWCVYEDKDRNLWIGTNAGLNRFDALTGEFLYYQHDPKDDRSLSHNIARTIYQTRNGELWVGTYHGLNRFDPEKKNFVRYEHDARNSLSLSANGIVSIFEDASGTLWIGTLGGGLNSFDRQSETFRRYLEQDGLPNSFVHSILQDDDGYLWLSTNKGLSRFNPLDESGRMFRNYDVNDGLQSNEFNAGAALRTRRGEMFFGGVNGMSCFFPKQVKDNPYIPAIAITGLKIFNQDIPLGESFPEMKEIKLSYKLNFFSFEFAALDFTDALRNQYAYMMDGFDKDWVYSGKRRFASYTNLDPGEYVFRVKGSNNDGIWNDEGTSIKVSIEPPFWGAWWFRGLVALGFLGLLWLIYHIRVSTLKKEKASQERFSKQLLEAQEQERKRIASELHDSLGQNLLIMKNTLEQTIRWPANKRRPLHELKELSDIASQSIDEVREISYNLHPHLLDRLGLTRAVESIIRKVRKSTEIDFSSEIDNVTELVSKDCDIHVFRIIQEGVNNVVRHSMASEARVRVKQVGDSLKITITDNGRGFDFAEYSSSASVNEGFGLTGISERVRILRGEFQVRSSQRGTALQVRIPVDASSR